MSQLHIDILDGIELSEMCEFLDRWLAQSPAAAASYNRFVGATDAVEDLRTALQHFAALIQVAPVTEVNR